jgi:tryptophan 2,3-dioxygenase
MAELDSSDFQRAFAAVSYLLGRRDGELLEPFAASPDTARLFVSRLAHPDRERRAEVLARELARLAVSLSARTLK